MASHANPVNWFEIPVSDMGRAKKFYETVFRFEIVETELGPNKLGWFPMEMGILGSPGTLIQGDGYKPSHDGSLVYLHVDKIDPTLEAINGADGNHPLWILGHLARGKSNLLDGSLLGRPNRFPELEALFEMDPANR